MKPIPTPSDDVLSRFAAKIEFGEPDDCWMWTARSNYKGYGLFTPHLGDNPYRAHRLAFVWLGGNEDPGALTIDHMCHNDALTCVNGSGCEHRLCVNPAHLEAVSMKVNGERGNSPPATNARKTHCPKGHPYSGDNLYTPRRGGRMCRTCHRERQHKYFLLNKDNPAFREARRQSNAKYQRKQDT